MIYTKWRYMEFIKNNLFEASKMGIISEEQYIQLLDLFLSKKNNSLESKRSGFDAVLYYLGSIIVLIAMVWLMSNAINHSTYVIILLLGSLYALVFFVSGKSFWTKNETLPASLLMILFICMITFLAMVIEKMTGFFPHFSDSNIYDNFYVECRPALILMAVTMVFTGVSVLKRYKSSIISLPVIIGSYSLFEMSGPVIIGNINEPTGIQLAWLSLIFSIITICLAILQDKSSGMNYSKWFYIFGTIMSYLNIIYLACSIETHSYNMHLQMLLIGFFGFLYMIISILLQQKVFIIVGSMGFLSYIFYLESQIFMDSPIVLSSLFLITGLLVVYSGIIFSKNHSQIDKVIEQLLR